MALPNLPATPVVKSSALQAPGGQGKRTAWDVQRAVLFALVMREMKQRVGGQWIGAIWTVFEPLAHTMVMVTMLGFVRGRVMPGIEYPVFLVTGLIPYFFFQHLTMRLMDGIAANRGIFAYRQVKPIDALLSRAVVEALMNLVVYLLTLGILAWLGFHVLPDLPLELIGVHLLIGYLGLSMGILAAVVSHDRPRVKSFIRVSFMPLYFITGVIFPIHVVPQDIGTGCCGTRCCTWSSCRGTASSPQYRPVDGVNLLYPLGFTLLRLGARAGAVSRQAPAADRQQLSRAVMLELQHITKSYPTPQGRRYVFRDLSFSFPSGANIGLDRSQRRRQVDADANPGRHRHARQRARAFDRQHLLARRAERRIRHHAERPRERRVRVPHPWRARPRDAPQGRLRARVRRDRRVLRSADEVLLVGHALARGVRPEHGLRLRLLPHRRGHGRRRRPVQEEEPRGTEGTPGARQSDTHLAQHGRHSAVLQPRRACRPGQHRAVRRRGGRHPKLSGRPLERHEVPHPPVAADAEARDHRPAAAARGAVPGACSRPTAMSANRRWPCDRAAPRESHCPVPPCCWPD